MPFKQFVDFQGYKNIRLRLIVPLLYLGDKNQLIILSHLAIAVVVMANVMRIDILLGTFIWETSLQFYNLFEFGSFLYIKLRNCCLHVGRQQFFYYRYLGTCSR